MVKSKDNKKLRTLSGTIVGASGVKDFRNAYGKEGHSAMLHIREDADGNLRPLEVAVKVSGDLCNYVGCVGARVAVDYVVRVFEFVKNGMRMLGNDVYATHVRMLGA